VAISIMQTISRTARRPAWRGGLLLSILVLAVLARLPGISTNHLTRDEAFAWRMSDYSTFLLLEHLRGDTSPPLSYLLLKAWVVLWGTSPLALRSLSMACSLATVGVLWFLSQGAGCLSSAGERTVAVGWGAAFFTSFLAASHPAQVRAAQDARMYSLGVLLAALTALLLLRALRRGGPWWCAYGIALDAFCYTHHFALFTLFAQLIFVGVSLIYQLHSRPFRETGKVAAGFSTALLVALLFCAPWLPVFIGQAREVHEGFWIPRVTAQEVERVGLSWMTGLECQPTLQSRLWLFLLGAIILWALSRGGQTSWFFFLQAIVPWACVLGISLFSGRSLFLERYLVFAQVGLFGLWGDVFRKLPSWPLRHLLAAVLAVPSVAGLSQYVAGLPDRPPAWEDAAHFLVNEARADDLFIIDDAREVNSFRYYMTQAGLPWLDVKARVDPFAKGHVVHVTSLEWSETYCSESDLWANAPRRVWWVSTSSGWSGPATPGVRLMLRRAFEGGGGTYCTFTLYQHGD
jgi:hypothetical protein